MARRSRIGSLALLALAAALPALAASRYSVKSVPVGAMPEQPLVAASHALVFVGLGGEPGVAVLDRTSDRVVETIATGETVDRIAFDPDRGRLYVAMPWLLQAFERGASGRFELVADVPTDLPLAVTVELDARADCVVVSDGSNARSFDGGSLALLGARASLLANEQLVVDEVQDRLFVPSLDGRVLVVDPETLAELDRIPAPQGLRRIAYSPLTNRIYQGIDPLWGFTSLVRIDLATGEDGVIPVGLGAWSFDLDPLRGQLYVGHTWSPFVSKIDERTLESRPIAVPFPTRTVLLEPAGRTLFAVDPWHDQVTAIDTEREQAVATYGVGDFPRHAVVDPVSGKLYTSNFAGGTVSIVRRRPNPDLSEVHVDPDTILADAVSTSTVTVVPRDDDGNLIGAGVSVVIEATAGSLLGVVQDLGDGSYTQRLRATAVAETAIVTAWADGVRLNSRPRVVFHIDDWSDVRESQPEWGLTDGGERVTIFGNGFDPTTSGPSPQGSSTFVYFGGSSAAIESLTDTEIVCITPPHAAGLVDVSVVLDDGATRRESFLRGGYTYVESENLNLLMSKGDQPGEVDLVWSTGPSGPVRVEYSSTPDFSADVTSVSGFTGPSATELSPAFPRVLYWRVVR